MKTYLTSILVLICFCYSSFSASVVLETDKDQHVSISIPTADQINQTIEDLRPLIPKSFQIAESLTLNLTELFSGNLITGDLDLANLTISKLNGFLLPYLNIIVTLPAYFRVILDLPEIDINSEYSINSTILDLLDIYGSGSASIHVTDLQVDVSGYVNVDLASVSIQNITDFKIDILLGNINIDVTGLLNDNDFSETASSLITTLANSLITSNLNQNHEQISADLSPKIEEIINNIINGGNSSTVLDSILEPLKSGFQQIFDPKNNVNLK